MVFTCFYFPDFGITAINDVKTKDMSMSGITNRQAMTWDKALMNPHSSCITNTIFRVVMKVMLSFHTLAMTTTEVMSPLSILAVKLSCRSC